MAPVLQLRGKRFGRLVVKQRAGRDKHNKALWLCVCDCGARTTTVTHYLICGDTRSCGCLHRDTLVRRNFRHGAALRGDQRTEYRAFLEAKRRCADSTRPNWKDYGGRGIQFKFTNFMEFYNEVGAKPNRAYSLDRINNDGHYEVGNVRWASRIVQNKNKRNSKGGK